MARNPKFFNRELSWLEFNQRVLDEALNPANPALERLKFLAITSSNLDEFFMVRVGGLKMQTAEGVTGTDRTGLTSQAQLDRIGERVAQMVDDQYRCYREDLAPLLAADHIGRIDPSTLTGEQLAYAETQFEDELYPVATPMLLTDALTQPLIKNRELHLAVRLKPLPGEATSSRHYEYAVLPIERSLSRFLHLPSDTGHQFLLIEDLARLFLERFFPGRDVMEAVPFRITRNADMRVQEDLASDLLSGMEEILEARKVSECVRLEIDARATKMMMRFFQRFLRLGAQDLFPIDGPLHLSDFMGLAGLEGHDHLKNASWQPQASPDIEPSKSMFDNIAQQSILLYNPYESFDPVVRLVEEAAEDPDVLAIKQILYRTSRNSPVVAALARAAEQGKYVTALVELKARFDEARNIEWAKALEQAGVQVIYGIRGYKTHAKLLLIVRREPQGIRRYMHFGTGNYNEATARLYTDASYLTCDPVLGKDASTFFNTISGYSQPRDYLKIEAAPLTMQDRLVQLIDAETERKKQGQKASIMAKVNSLADPRIIEALYRASKAGVEIQLNIRGICCLRPGVKGLSENISVVSIVDRYLEHSRMFSFYHGGDRLVFISSADWMVRNLVKRVELMVPVEEKKLRNRLIDLLKTCFRDNVNAWDLLPDGSYQRRKALKNKQAVRSQQTLYDAACKASGQNQASRRPVFEPHRAAEK